MTAFIDTNIFLRYLTGDDPARGQSALALFRRIRRGEVEAVTREVHVHEVAYVLASPSQYNLSHTEIRDLLSPLLSLRGLKIGNKRLVLEALNTRLPKM
jgi:predicted nucleic acid-binding protein